MIRVLRMVAVGLAVVPLCALAQSVVISGTVTELTSDPAAQYAPSIDGDIVVFNDTSSGHDIAYIDLATGTQTTVTGGDAQYELHDVSGRRIAYTYSNQPSAVRVYDLDSGVTSEPGTPGRAPSIEGDSVVFESDAASSDIHLYDVASGTDTLVVGGSAHDTGAGVSSAWVVYLRDGAEVWAYDRASGDEQLVGAVAFPERPSIDGDVVAWVGAGAAGDTDIHLKDLSTGTVTVIARAGNQAQPRLSGDMLAFDEVAGADTDVVLHHLPSGTFHSVPGAGSNEFLNDLDGTRAVFTTDRHGNWDIGLYEFVVTAIPEDDPGGGDDPEALVCEDGLGPASEAWTFERSTGKPVTVSVEPYGAGTAWLAVENSGCGAAVVTLNGEELLGPDAFSAEPSCTAMTVELDAVNELTVEARGKPGCEVTVKVWYPFTFSCSTTSGGAGWFAVLLALLLLIASRRRPTRARVRIRRRR